jgi:predicted RNase H-like nuclease (RuvC/YqgF family)
MKMDLRASSRASAYSAQVLQTSIMRSLGDSGLDSHSAHDEDAHVTEKKESSASNAKVEPSVSQAEKRIVHLEQLLEEMYERNYALAEVVKTLTREKEETQTKLDQWTGTDVPDLVCKVLDEKSDLQKKLSRLGIVLRDMGLNESGHQMGLSNEIEGISMMGMDPERPTALTNYLENKARSLQVENETLEVENDNYRRQVEELQAEVWKKELAIPVFDEHSISVSLRCSLSSMPSSCRSEREASDHERLLAFLKVLELQKQVSELKKSEQIVEGTANDFQQLHILRYFL